MSLKGAIKLKKNVEHCVYLLVPILNKMYRYQYMYKHFQERYTQENNKIIDEEIRGQSEGERH